MSSSSEGYHYGCFPPPGSIIYQINVYNRGFPAEFLITKWWSDYPSLQTTLYVFGAIQLLLALAIIIMGIGRNINMKELGWEGVANRKILTVLTGFWQLALSGLILFLPTQWLSNITMGMILFHAWAEFFALVLRFLILKQQVSKSNLQQYFMWSVITYVVTGVPFMLGSNPYIQGIISTVLVLPADFLNIVVAPMLSILWVKSHPTAPASEKASEILMGFLSVFHVIWFYGQGIIGCAASLEAGAQFFVALQVISTSLLLGMTIAYGITIRTSGEWSSPMKQVKTLFHCCFSFQADDEEKTFISFEAKSTPNNGSDT